MQVDVCNTNNWIMIITSGVGAGCCAGERCSAVLILPQDPPEPLEKGITGNF